MNRDYDKWHKKKSELSALKTRPEFRTRDIWFCHLGLNIGDEENGSDEGHVRPVTIVRKFNTNLCSIVPLTRTLKESPYYFQFSFIEGEVNSAILSQQRSVDSKRLAKKMGFISKSDFKALTEKLKELIP